MKKTQIITSLLLVFTLITYVQKVFNKNVSILQNSEIKTFDLASDSESVNVMGSLMPSMPTFPALAKKPGKVRGYAKDLTGKALEGAYISVSVSAYGGFYSDVHGETDANGYYELQMPEGAGYFSSAAYSADYGEGRIAVGLHPADGKVSSFPTKTGEVENFVLVPYGIANRNGASDNPMDIKNYYGGSLRVLYTIRSEELTDNTLPQSSEIELTLTPNGGMMPGAVANTFVFRRRAEISGKRAFYINNIPIGQYAISARLTNGKSLKLEQTSVTKPESFGLKPRQANGSGSLLFSASADPIGVVPAYGNWLEVSVQVSLP